MEEIYLKGFTRRDWCSDRVHLKSYFEEYSNALSMVNLTKKTLKSEMEILHLFVPQSNQLSPEEMISLREDSDGKHLTTLHEDDLINKCLAGFEIENRKGKLQEESAGKESNEKEVLSIGTHLTTLQEGDLSKNCLNDVQKPKEKIQEVRKESNVADIPSRKSRRNRFKQSNSARKEIRVDVASGNGVRDLNPRSHFKVMFRVYEPFNQVVGDNSRPGRFTQEIAVLGHQPLTSLRDSIICESDFQDVRGDISENPNAPVTERARDKYPSNMFYFDNTFYVDKREEGNLDYSEPIRSWGVTRGIEFGPSKSMHFAKVEDLTIRFGYPYVYMHQGCCEHIICISDASLLTMKDSMYSLDYPLLTKTSHVNMMNCLLCSRLPVKWIVRDCDYLAHDPTYECKDCFKSFHYINGKKVGQFKAFPYVQRSALL